MRLLKQSRVSFGFNSILNKGLKLVAALIAIVWAHGPAEAADRLTLQLNWELRGQFAGIYVAREKGFFSARDLDVTIKPGGPAVSPVDVMANGGADVAIMWMPTALLAREQGVPLVNIAQMFDTTGLVLVCSEDAAVQDVPTDLAGKSIGVWQHGKEIPIYSWLQSLGLSLQGGDQGVTLINQTSGVDMLLGGAADCVSAMEYDELHQILGMADANTQLSLISLIEQGGATLEDGLYVLEQSLSDEGMTDRLSRFVAAVIEGWSYAARNPREAAEYVVKNDRSATLDIDEQTRMVDEIADMLGDVNGEGIGALSSDDYLWTVGLLTAGEEPVLSDTPIGAWTRMVYDRALESQ